MSRESVLKAARAKRCVAVHITYHFGDDMIQVSAATTGPGEIPQSVDVWVGANSPDPVYVWDTIKHALAAWWDVDSNAAFGVLRWGCEGDPGH